MGKQLVLGTAGHIDHGKTSLIRNLTGIDTDRLKEEKARGITIELGFAHMILPSGTNIGIVDVPGHEKFVRHMVAGASGVDLVALVIAADEGIMPQTREHLEICQLLGVRYGLIVLTKVDMVEPDWIELVEEDVGEFVSGTFLEDAEMIHFSAVTGAGREDVIQAVANAAAKVEERQAGGLFRMPLDRVFTMKGFGTVVTGTSISGKIALGDTVMIYPGELTAKVRGLQVHGQSVEEANAGLRTAINLQGLERDSILRGQVLGPPDILSPSKRMDLWINYLSSNEKPLKNRTQIRFHVGTSENLGRLLLLDREEMAAGDSGPAQVLLEDRAVALSGDRFVIRSYSPVRTIAGGEILNPLAPRHKRFNERVLADLEVLKEKDPVGSLKVMINGSGTKGMDTRELAGLIDLPAKKIKSAVDKILSDQEAIAFDKERGRLIGKQTFEQLADKVIDILAAYHKAFPVRPGLGKEELKTRVAGLSDPKLLSFLLDRLTASGKLVVAHDLVHLADHKVELAGDFQEIEKRLVQIFKTAALTPPYLKDVVSELAGSSKQHKEVVEHLLKQGELVKVKADLYYHRPALEEVWELARKPLKEQGELTTPQFKELTGLSRKYLIPLLEYFDSRGLTMRIGDKRILRADKDI